MPMDSLTEWGMLVFGENIADRKIKVLQDSLLV